MAAGATADMGEQSEHDRRLDYVEFQCPGIERARDFYSAVFGWEFTAWGDDYLSFDDGRLTGGFRRGAEPSAGNPLVVLYAVDLERAQAEVAGAGGTVVREIFSFPGGRRFEFEDPCGNRLAVWSDR